MAEGLVIKNLSIERAGRPVITDLSLFVEPGELVQIRGKNGSGKSTLALTIMGSSLCISTNGEMIFEGHNLKLLRTFERAKLGIFLAHQEPPALSGVSTATAFRAMSDALRSVPLSTSDFFAKLRVALKAVGLTENFIDRPLNEDFSGGEKKRTELAALLFFEPKLAILDEVDSGMDVSSRALAQTVIASLRERGTSFLLITHNEDFARSLAPSQIVDLAS